MAAAKHQQKTTRHLLDPRPTVTARTSLQPDSREAAATSAISAFLLGQSVADATFNHVSGDEQATKRLLAALAGSV